MALDTLANVKARLGITTSADDALLDLLRDSADAFVVAYCQRDFTTGPFTEYFPGFANTVRLRNYPDASVTSLKMDPSGGFGAETLVDATAYVVDADRGIIYLRYGTWTWHREGTQRAVQVVYSASGTVPDDVKQAYAELVGHWYRHVKTQIAAEWQNVTQQTFGDATAIFAKDQIAGLPLPPDIARLLGPHRSQPL